jgi:hypothetical protein
MSGYDPVSSRVQPVLARIHRESQRMMASPIPFATVCTGLNFLSDLHARLLRRLIEVGYVTEVGIGRVLLTAAGSAQVAAQRA